MQEGGDVSFLAADYQALLADVQPPPAAASRGGSDQQGLKDNAAVVPDHSEAGLDGAVESIKQLFKDCCRLSTGTTTAVQRQVEGLDKLLRSEAAGVCSMDAAVKYMSSLL